MENKERIEAITVNNQVRFTYEEIVCTCYYNNKYLTKVSVDIAYEYYIRKLIKDGYVSLVYDDVGCTFEEEIKHVALLVGSSTTITWSISNYYEDVLERTPKSEVLEYIDALCTTLSYAKDYIYADVRCSIFRTFPYMFNRNIEQSELIKAYKRAYYVFTRKSSLLLADTVLKKQIEKMIDNYQGDKTKDQIIYEITKVRYV